ncbi:MAG: DMT family transporter [Hyphomicrobiales bacterium]|nr:DMT family transporter [Hyphomicrobiales bacterium]
MSGLSLSSLSLLGRLAGNRSSPKVAVVLVVLSVSVMAVSEAVFKHLVQDYHAVQLMWCRYVFFLVPILLFVGRRWLFFLQTRRLSLQVGRALLAFAGGLLLVIGLKYVSLAETTAIVFAYPLFVIVLSVPLLGERLYRCQVIAVAFGFLGVVVMMRPGGEAMQWAALLPLSSAVLAALFQITTKMLTASDRPLSTLLYTGIVGVAVATLPLPLVWQTPRIDDWLPMASLGLCYAIASYLWIRALEMAMASTLAPFIYSKIVAATALGLFVFGEVPDLPTFIGATLIIGSGLYAFHGVNADPGYSKAEDLSLSRHR